MSEQPRRNGDDEEPFRPDDPPVEPFDPPIEWPPQPVDPTKSAAVQARVPGAARTIDAHLLATTITAGETATLLVTLRVPSSRSQGQFQGLTMVSERDGPVSVILHSHGFTLLSEPPGPISLTPDRDSPPVAFQLLIEEKKNRWLHLILFQAERVVGELAINDFSSLDGKGRQISKPMLKVQEADLTIVVRTAEPLVEVCSPRERANLYYSKISGITSLTTPFKTLLREKLRALYDESAQATEIERELKIVGSQLSKCLSSELKGLLRRADIRTVMLHHEGDLDFPLELCFGSSVICVGDHPPSEHRKHA